MDHHWFCTTCIPRVCGTWIAQSDRTPRWFTSCYSKYQCGRIRWFDFGHSNWRTRFQFAFPETAYIQNGYALGPDNFSSVFIHPCFGTFIQAFEFSHDRSVAEPIPQNSIFCTKLSGFLESSEIKCHSLILNALKIQLIKILTNHSFSCRKKDVLRGEGEVNSRRSGRFFMLQQNQVIREMRRYVDYHPIKFLFMTVVLRIMSHIITWYHDKCCNLKAESNLQRVNLNLRYTGGFKGKAC